ncbi:hypothetical protein V6Z11_A02G158600 [Gossypium hirsutum]
MKLEFEMIMVREFTYFLGLEVKQLGGIFISQEKYVSNMVKKFNLGQAKNARTLMSFSDKLEMDKVGVSVDSTMYIIIIIWSIIYLKTSKLDICQIVGVCTC